jgi:hypothetical protein
MRAPIVALSMVFAAACVSSNETKVAAAETTAALKQLREMGSVLKDDLSVSIDNSIDAGRRLAIARGVRSDFKLQVTGARTGELSAFATYLLRSREKYRYAVDQFLGSCDAMWKGIDELSAKKRGLDKRSEAYKKLDEQIAKIDTSPTAAVNAFMKKWADEIREGAKAFDEGSEDRKNLEAFADSLSPAAGAAATPFRKEFVTILESLAVLVKTKHAVARNLTGYDDHVAALQGIHSQVEEWVMTDVNVSGEQVAELIKKHEDVLGLGSPVK